MPSDDDRGGDRVDLVYGAIVGVLYALAVGVQVYLVVDEVTGGALSDDVRARWRRLTASWHERRRIDREVREGAPHVVWAAIEALNEEGTTP